MELKIREHIQELFRNAPSTAQSNELKEEIIRNTIDRYHDAIYEGKSENEAYKLAIEGIGDINELFAELGCEPVYEASCNTEQLAISRDRYKTFKGIAVALYILCVTPVILLSGTPIIENIAPALMFFMISAATGLLIYGSKTRYINLEQNPETAAAIKQNAIMKAIAVGLFISCPTPPILLSNSPLCDISPVFMFLMIAAGVMLLIFNKSPDSSVDKEKLKHCEAAVPANSNTSLYRLLVAVLWVLASIFYIVVTALHPFSVAFTWLIFPLAAALQGVMHAIFDYKGAK